jgi:RNA polymerase sigma-70 factor (ECF subfamily)
MSRPTQQLPSESQLLVARGRVDREAFGELCERAYPAIFRYCQRRLPDHQTAEDVTADVFLSVARQVRTFPGQTYEEFLRWNYAIATNQVNVHLRSTIRRAQLLEAAAERGAIKVANLGGEPIDRPALDWQEVYKSLLNLNLRDQSIIALRFFEELSFDEIAKTLQMQPSAVRTAYVRALEKLRSALGVKP